MGARGPSVIVVDCSYVMAMVMHDEQRPASLEPALAARLFAPSIWPLEVANALRNGVRRRRLGHADVPGICARIEACEIEVVGLAGLAEGDVRQHYQAARNHDLTPYDAAYLELALQRRCALATLDNGLAGAARRAGVTVLD